MTAAQITSLRPEIDRDRYGRPLVVPPEGGKPIPYTRATTFVGAIEDTYGIGVWKQRMTALGLADRPDLLLRVVASRGDNKAVDAAADDAFMAAGGNAAATVGTALHLLTEKVDTGEEVGVVPEMYEADVAAYAEATRELKAVLVETFCVQDKFKVGGTPDRVVSYQGKRYIADLKTGSIDKGYLKIAAQLAMYARSRTYDIATHERGAHGAEIDRGIVIHLPAGTGRCTLYWIDLLVGWEAALLAARVRETRQQRFADVVGAWGQPFTPKPNLIRERENKPVGHVGDADAPRDYGTTPEAASVEECDEASSDFIAAAIAAASTPDEVRALWTPEWTPEQVALATARVAELSS